MNSLFLIIVGILVVGFFATFVFSTQSTPTSYADSIFESCYDDDECTIDMMYQLSQNNSTQTVLLTIDDLVDLYVDADFYCHPAAHHLGEFLYGYVGRNLEMASDISDYRCASGIMHGLVENTIQIENMLDGTPIESVDIRESCKTIGDALGDDAKKECIHGMGHSLIKIYDYDTTQALERCNEFDTWNEVYMCNGGLFMQNIAKYAENRQGDFDESDLYYPCNQIDGTKNAEAATLCHRYQANYFLIQTDYILQNAYSLCSGIEDQRYIGICYKGVAAHLTKDNFDVLDNTQLMCLSTPPQYQEQCVIGAIESLTRFVSDEKASEFCNRLDGDLQKTCQNRMNSLIDSRYD
ncbi:hypothetical protein [Nitrosopumilus sp. b2]|uniref:hypothetical protein n=1 Tax=Nitrosopumilus sp. b2 TaxID=2109908 RepID=UPI0015F3CADE|nr:hypothetical protein [Nitrosopumilus sp. b2]KAF6245191.1 hypothetical protein C6989_04475 [Nitrosopumilus sp. b2]